MIDLRRGDCLELMHDIPDGSVDMILCDLPYGTTRNKWDTIIPLDRLWEQYKRITKKNAAIVLFSQQPFTTRLIGSNPKMFRYEWIWKKPTVTGFLNANKMPLKTHENICVFYRCLPRYIPQYTWGGVIFAKVIMPLVRTMGNIIRWSQYQMAVGTRRILLKPAISWNADNTQHRSPWRCVST